MLVAQKVAITRIAGVNTPEAIDNLKDKIGGIFTLVDVPLHRCLPSPFLSASVTPFLRRLTHINFLYIG